MARIARGITLSKKINTRELIDRIEKLAKSRIASEPVVSLDQFRAADKKLNPKTLLIIEDDESMRSAMKRMLEPEGYITKLAADATELGTILDESHPDLILLDIGLPWINGFELAQMLKEHRDLKSIPLIFVSGTASEDDIKKAFSIGADDFIKKPFEVGQLRKAVHTLLKLNE
jgi:two-component system, OmpR family, aerobic respiration control protein ArcA